jgi:hypothetical protein
MPLSATCIGSLCALIAQIFSCPLEMEDFIPSDQKLSMARLQNGVSAIVQEHAQPAKSASIKLVFRDSPLEYAAAHLATADLEELEHFLKDCQTKLLLAEKNCWGQTDDTLYNPQDLGIVAVGDFPKSEVAAIVERVFSSLSHHPSGEMHETWKPILLKTSPERSDAVLSIFFSSSQHPVKIIQDLRKQWIDLLFQGLFQERMQIKLLSENLVAEAAAHTFITPSKAFGITTRCTGNQAYAVLDAMLTEIEKVKRNGFSIEEFSHSKAQFLEKIEQMKLKENIQLASFHADRFVQDAGSVPFEFFIEASSKLLESISLKEVGERAVASLADVNRSIDIACPESCASDFSQARLSLLLAKAYQNPSTEEGRNDLSADEVKTWTDNLKPTSKLQEQLLCAQTVEDSPQLEFFFSLPLDDNEKRVINAMILTIAEKNVIKLGLMRKTIEKKGKRIHHVHPLRFIGYIFATPHLKTSMHKIRKSSFKWDGFIDGFSKKMKDESNNGNLIQYIPGFAEYLDVDFEECMHYVHKKDWEGFVKFLL